MKVIDNVPRDLWDHVVVRCGYATFFHTSTWAEIMTQTHPRFRIATKGFVLDDSAVAVVPLMATTERNRYFKWYESMLPGVYGGAVAERNLTQTEINSIFRHLANARTAHIHVMGNPYTDHELPPSYNRSPLYTQVLSLDKGFDAIFENMHRSKRRGTRKARKMGVEVGVAEREEEFRSYYEVYKDAVRRWGDRTLISYPYGLFEQLYRYRSENLKLWIAKVDGRIVSGNVVVYHNRHCAYWHGATLESYFSYRPGALLITEIIRDACQRGLACCDLSPSGGLKGVERYKEQFGAQAVPFYSYRWNDNKVHQAYHKAVALIPGLLKRTKLNRDQKEALVGWESRTRIASATSGPDV